MLRIAICDDDVAFTSNLEDEIVQSSRRLGLQADTEVFFDGNNLLKSVQSGCLYNLIFIDIEMEHINGIETARFIREIDRAVLIIYISGHEQYLKELFEVEPFRFLLKPLDLDKFHIYFNDACKRIIETDEFYQFQFNKEIKKVPLRDIVYFESRKRMVYIILADGTSEQFYGKLNEVESNLEESRSTFLRIHQSFLVNYDYIKNMNFSSVVIYAKGKTLELKISEDRQKNVRQRLCEIGNSKVVIQ